MKTKSGFDYEIDPEVLDDWELIEEMTEMVETNDPTHSVRIFKRVLGDDQYGKLKTFLKERDGRVKTTAMIEEFNSILQGEDLKKSMP